MGELLLGALVLFAIALPFIIIFFTASVVMEEDNERFRRESERQSREWSERMDREREEYYGE